MPAPNVSLTFSAGVEALRRIEEQRSAREAQMRNALEILSKDNSASFAGRPGYERFVRATAREGLGRE
jgi:hypothetical protein